MTEKYSVFKLHLMGVDVERFSDVECLRAVQSVVRDRSLLRTFRRYRALWERTSGLFADLGFCFSRVCITRLSNYRFMAQLRKAMEGRPKTYHVEVGKLSISDLPNPLLAKEEILP